jgi:hypothetical protein
METIKKRIFFGGSIKSDIDSVDKTSVLITIRQDPDFYIDASLYYKFIVATLAKQPIMGLINNMEIFSYDSATGRIGSALNMDSYSRLIAFIHKENVDATKIQKMTKLVQIITQAIQMSGIPYSSNADTTSLISDLLPVRNKYIVREKDMTNTNLTDNDVNEIYNNFIDRYRTYGSFINTLTQSFIEETKLLHPEDLQRYSQWKSAMVQRVSQIKDDEQLLSLVRNLTMVNVGAGDEYTRYTSVLDFIE